MIFGDTYNGQSPFFLNANNNHFHKWENKSEHVFTETFFFTFAIPRPILSCAQPHPHSSKTSLVSMPLAPLRRLKQQVLYSLGGKREQLALCSLGGESVSLNQTLWATHWEQKLAGLSELFCTRLAQWLSVLLFN